MAKQFVLLGDAKRYADESATRDGCVWNVWFDTWDERYVCASEFEDKDFYWKKHTYKATPQTSSQSGITVTLDPDEYQLLKYILSDKYDRDVYPGEEKTKDSFLKKLLGIGKQKELSV